MPIILITIVYNKWFVSSFALPLQDYITEILNSLKGEIFQKFLER